MFNSDLQLTDWFSLVPRCVCYSTLAVRVVKVVYQDQNLVTVDDLQNQLVFKPRYFVREYPVEFGRYILEILNMLY